MTTSVQTIGGTMRGEEATVNALLLTSPVRISATPTDQAEAMSSTDSPGVSAEDPQAGWSHSGKPRSWPVWLWHGAWRAGEWFFGWLSLLVGLALIATLPLVSFVSLGYLLECSGRIARTGKFRSGFIDIDRWARLGSLFIGTWLVLLLPRFVADLANDAYLIHGAGPIAGAWRIGQLVTTALVMGHILLAWYCGGKLRHFFWPLLAPFSLGHWVATNKLIAPLVRPLLQRLWPSLATDLFTPQPLSSWFPPAILWHQLRRGLGTMYQESRDAVYDFVVALQIPYYFWLGLRGFAGAILWLIVPVTLLVIGARAKNDGVGFLFNVIGGSCFAYAISYLPFLQTRFAAEQRFMAFFEPREIRQRFRRAPFLFWLTLLVTLSFALPLYLAKVQRVFVEFEWLLSFFFVGFGYPGRLLSGWAMACAYRREQPRNFLLRWGFWLGQLPLLFFYVLIVILSQYTSWNGSWSLLEQHPFLVPVPFLGGGD